MRRICAGRGRYDHKISISLYELAYATHLYGAMTGFDRALSKARQALQPEADLVKPEHRDATLDFLRKWGCQHLALAGGKLSSDALLSWWRTHATDLPKPGQSLETLGDEELVLISPEKVKTTSTRRISLLGKSSQTSNVPRTAPLLGRMNPRGRDSEAITGRRRQDQWRRV